MSGVILLFLLSMVPVQRIAPVQVLKISAGPAGSESNGVFTLSEERSVFSRSSDREIIVFFQWEHVPGPHKLVAQWRSPDGGASASSAIDYNAADKRFGAYWRLPVTAAMPLGTWSIEVTMDGRPAGRFTFDITDVQVEAPLSRRPLTEAELFERLNRRFIVLRRLAGDGRELGAAAGFVLAPEAGHLGTVVPALDSAAVLRAILPDGTTQDVTHLVAWNRRQHWAVLQGPTSALEPLQPAAYDKIKVGSRVFSMEGSTAGIRVLVGGTVTGQVRSSFGSPVWVATFPGAFGMPGAPVLDEYGDVLGVLGVGMPGDPRPVDDILAARDGLNGAPVIPFTDPARVPVTPAADLATLRAKSDVMSPLVTGAQIATGGFARGPTKRRDGVPAEFVDEFSLGDKTMGLFVSWAPTERVRGQAVAQLFDADNKMVATSQPRKINFRKGDLARSTWDIPMPQSPGMYRVDVRIDAGTYWRGFVRINP